MEGFQWDISELIQQQDIQEFCRVLFDALETGSGLRISHLYEGELIDYVHCTECGNQSTRIDKFLDISLPITDPFTSV